MTLDEAIKYLEEMVEIGETYEVSTGVEEHRQLAEWLKELKAYKKNTCGDAISRDELLKAMDTWDKFGYTETGCFVREPKNDCVKYIHYDDVIKCIKGMPSVTPQPRTGRWIEGYEWVCSNCGTHHRALYDYCPSCGTKMEVEE